MFKQRLHTLLLFILLFIMVIGCSEQTTDKKTDKEKGGVLNVAYSTQPPTADLHITTAVATSDIMRGVFETLVTLDSDFNTQPMLAESYEVSDDGKQITFYLREGVFFHNGKEMTAEDVVASMDRWKEHSTKGKAQFSEATFEALDDYTVILTFPKRLSTALNVLSGTLGSYPGIMPKEVIEAATETGVQELIGTGPFKFEEWKQDAYIRLTKYDDYQPLQEDADGLSGKKEALVDEIYFRFVLDSSTRMAGLLSGEYDIADALSYDSMNELEASELIETNIVPGSSLILTFNKKKGIFSDLKAREAVLTALSMEDMMQAAFGDDMFYTLNHNLVMPYLEEKFYSDAGKDIFNQNNPEKGKQIIEESGYIGEEITILTTRDREELYSTSIVVQERLEQIGLNIHLEVVDWPTFLKKRQEENEFDLHLTSYGPQTEPTSYGFIMRGSNSGWIEDEAFHELIDQFRSQPSLEDTKDIYDAIATWNAENIPFIKIADYSRIIASQKTIDNFQYQEGYIVWNVSKSE